MPTDFTPNEIAALGYEQHQIDRMSDEEREALADRLDMGIDIDESKLNAKEEDDGHDEPGADEKADVKAGGDGDGDPGADAAADVADPDKADPKTGATEPKPAGGDGAAAATTEEDDTARLKAEAKFELECDIFDQSYIDKPQSVDTTKEKADLEALTAERTELRKKLREGDIEQEEHDSKIDALEDKMLDVRADIRVKERQASGAQQSEEQRWSTAQDKFFGHGPNGELKSDPVNYAVLNSFVSQLSLKPENLNRGFLWLLREAGRLTRERMHLPDPAKPRAAAEVKPKDPLQDKTKRPTRKPDTTKVPQTLSTVPQADVNNDQDPANEFSHLDNLDGEKLQKAMEKMSSAQMKRYREIMG